jgi:hypothetical protein
MSRLAFLPSGYSSSFSSSSSSPSKQQSLSLLHRSNVASLHNLSPTVATTSHATSTLNHDDYGPVIPDTTTLGSMVVVIVILLVATMVWNTQVVPISRTRLAISKSRGSVRSYLEKLKNDEDSHHKDEEEEYESTNDNNNHHQHQQEQQYDDENRNMMTVGYNSTSCISPQESQSLPQLSQSPTRQRGRKDNRALERWLFTDWLQNLDDKKSSTSKSSSRRGRRKDPAIPGILPEAKWNSGDNPVLVTVFIMMVGIVLASITERFTT